MLKNRKILIVFSVLLIVGIITISTFAWSNRGQSSTSAYTGFVNPDVNLHDDSGKSHKNVFVENSGGEPLYIRISLSEWMQINGETLKSETGKAPMMGADGTKGWFTHIPITNLSNDCGEAFHKYYNWQMGDIALSGQNKFYLTAPFANRALFDEQGIQTAPPIAVTAATSGASSLFGTNPAYDTVTMEAAYTALNSKLNENHSGDTTVYQYLNSIYSKIDNAIEAGDTLTQQQLENEVNAYISNPDNKLGYYDKVFDVTADGKIDANYKIVWKPILRTLKTQKVFTMSDWFTAGKPMENSWVIDSDGWCYWANKLMPDSATGLLLSEITPENSNKPNGKWEYKITADLQAVTSDDIDRFSETSPSGIGGITPEAEILIQTISSNNDTTSSKEFSADNYTWQILDDGKKTGKALIISKDVLRRDIENANLNVYLTYYADGIGGGELKSITNASPTSTARLISPNEATTLFADNSSRIAKVNMTEDISDWWLSDGSYVSSDGSIQNDSSKIPSSGMRVAIDIDVAKLNELISKSGVS